MKWKLYLRFAKKGEVIPFSKDWTHPIPNKGDTVMYEKIIARVFEVIWNFNDQSIYLILLEE